MQTNPGSKSADVTVLLEAAQSSGLLSQGAADALQIADIGEQIAAAMGAPAGDTQASEVVLVQLLIDDSGSIRMVAGNTEAVREGHNTVLDALKGAKAGDGVQVHCRYLNGTLLYPFVPLDHAVEMTQRNYNPNGGTPLYDQSLAILATLIAKTADFENNGIPARTVTAIITDGCDQGSNSSAADVKKVVRDLLKKENHIVCGVGIDDGSTNFEQVFGDMGIPKEWILTPGNSPTEIRKAFAMVSKSAQRASQAAAGSFSKTAAGGFGAP
ncbi:MAG: hypothetical protein AAB365_01475 [Patescibacteria group bacterium]